MPQVQEIIDEALDRLNECSYLEWTTQPSGDFIVFGFRFDTQFGEISYSIAVSKTVLQRVGTDYLVEFLERRGMEDIWRLLTTKGGDQGGDTQSD